jgi:AmmeMemoRadiSam system protein A
VLYNDWVELSDDDRRELVRIAKATLREYVEFGEVPPGKPHRERLLEPAAVFCSLHRHGSLRGCMGTTSFEMPLYRAVEEMAVAAASRDPRFPPVSLEELQECEVELSVLSALEQISDESEVEVGRHGLMITKGYRRGLLLPQVASKRGWSSTQFLEETCTKAGLPRDAWREPDAKIERFEAQVFDEHTHPPIDPAELRRRAGLAK